MGTVPSPTDKSAFCAHDTDYWLRQINRASVVANTERGLLPRDLACRIRDALSDMAQAAAKPGAKHHNLYITFEPELLKRCGTEASILHAGRSSQDILATANAGMNRVHLLMTADALCELIAALIKVARREADAIVPAYTNGVQAQPGLYGHYLLAQVQVFRRDCSRLLECHSRYCECPMGSCVCNGTGWDLDTARMAALLGFDGPAENAFDVGQCQGNDLPMECAQILTGIMLHINAFLADFMTQYAQAHPWIRLESTNGVYRSSAMPQKRNPGLVNDCRRDAGLVQCEADAVLRRMQNLPLGMADVRDAPCMKALFDDACVVIRTFASIVSTLRVDRDRALAEINADWTCTQEIADTLMREAGIDFRTGHRFASSLVSAAREQALTPLTATYETFTTLWTAFAKEHEGLPETFPLTEAQLAHATDPALILKNRRTPGSASPAMVADMLTYAYAWLTACSERIAVRVAQQRAAEKLLNEALRAL